MEKRRYAFSWDLIGDIENSRPHLGPTLRVEAYRLLQFCFRDVLEQRYGSEEVDKIFFEAGHLAGVNFYKNLIDPNTSSFSDLVQSLQKILKDMGIGILTVEEANLETMHFVLAVGEDLDCSGLPELDFEICVYDEGFLAGILKSFTGRDFKVKEVDCWCTNARTCRFEVTPIVED